MISVVASFCFFVTSAAIGGGSMGGTTGATTGEGEGSGEAAAAADGDELRLISLRSGVGAAGDDELAQIGGGGGGWAGGGRS
jgi:hypothetical protein